MDPSVFLFLSQLIGWTFFGEKPFDLNRLSMSSYGNDDLQYSYIYNEGLGIYVTMILKQILQKIYFLGSNAINITYDIYEILKLLIILNSYFVFLIYIY